MDAADFLEAEPLGKKAVTVVARTRVNKILNIF